MSTCVFKEVKQRQKGIYRKIKVLQTEEDQKYYIRN